MTTLRFREHQTTPNTPLTTRQIQLLRHRFDCHVIPTDVGGGYYHVTPTSIVGALVDGDTTIVIAPKLPIARVLFLLAHTVDSAAWHADDAALAAANSLTDGVVALFTMLCDRALRDGILHGYRGREERLYTVRGRIDFAEQLRSTPGRDLPLAVSYQEYTEDIPENQLLAAALHAMSALPVHSTDVRRTLGRLRDALTHVTLVRYDLRRIPQITWTRLNTHYRPAVELAQLILTGAEPDLATGTVRVPALTMNMNTVFEHFVRTATRRALGVTETEFPAGDDTPPVMLDEAGRLRLKPDLSRWIDGRCRFVGELKYRYDTGTGTAPNLYQTLAYAVAAGVPNATLIYADGPHNVAPPHHIPNAGLRIHLRHLDLRAEPTALLHQIQTLADHINHLTTQTQISS